MLGQTADGVQKNQGFFLSDFIKKDFIFSSTVLFDFSIEEYGAGW